MCLFFDAQLGSIWNRVRRLQWIKIMSLFGWPSGVAAWYFWDCRWLMRLPGRAPPQRLHLCRLFPPWHKRLPAKLASIYHWSMKCWQGVFLQKQSTRKQPWNGQPIWMHWHNENRCNFNISQSVDWIYQLSRLIQDILNPILLLLKNNYGNKSKLPISGVIPRLSLLWQNNCPIHKINSVWLRHWLTHKPQALYLRQSISSASTAALAPISPGQTPWQQPRPVIRCMLSRANGLGASVRLLRISPLLLPKTTAKRQLRREWPSMAMILRAALAVWQKLGLKSMLLLLISRWPTAMPPRAGFYMSIIPTWFWIAPI